MNKREAAAYLRTSERSVNRLVSSGHLSVTYRKLPNGASEAIFDEGQVKALKDSPPPRKNAENRSTTALARREEGRDLRELLASLLESRNTSPAVRPSEKLTLTLRDAALLSGLSRGYLLEAIKAGKLRAEKRGRGWNIKRSDLEKWIESL